MPGALETGTLMARSGAAHEYLGPLYPDLAYCVTASNRAVGLARCVQVKRGPKKWEYPLGCLCRNERRQSP